MQTCELWVCACALPCVCVCDNYQRKLSRSISGCVSTSCCWQVIHRSKNTILYPNSDTCAFAASIWFAATQPQHSFRFIYFVLFFVVLVVARFVRRAVQLTRSASCVMCACVQFTSWTHQCWWQEKKKPRDCTRKSRVLESFEYASDYNYIRLTRCQMYCVPIEKWKFSTLSNEKVESRIRVCVRACPVSLHQ